MTTDITTRLRLERSDLCVEAAIAIEQLRERLHGANGMTDDILDQYENLPIHSAKTMQMAMEEIRRLRARIVELEAEIATMRGTVAQPAADEPATFTHNVPPSAPR